MNIVLYVPSFLPKTLGGRELVVHYLAKSFRELGHSPRVLGPAGWWEYRNLDFGYPVHRWPTLRGHFVEQIARAELMLDIALFGCDILHVHATYPQGYVSSKLGKGRRFPFILTPHGADIHMVPEVGYGLRLNAEKDQKIRKAVGGADMLTAISASVEDSLLSAGADPDRILHIPNGVDLDRFASGKLSKSEVCAKLGLPSDAKIILTIGRYEPRKGQEVLIKAMPRILERIKQARLVIIGKKTEALNGLITSLGLQDKVCLAGTFSPPNILLNDGQDGNEPDWLAECCRQSSVYVSASIDEGAEGLSLALLEGMAAGLPVVATRISGNKDVIEDGRNGFVVTPGNANDLANALINVLENEDIRTEMGENSRKGVESYAWIEVAKQYLRCYEDARSRLTDK